MAAITLKTGDNHCYKISLQKQTKMAEIKLSPTTNYCFTEEDFRFILELAKVGYVNLLTYQVLLITGAKKGFAFKYSGDENECKGLQLPQDWYIETIYPQGDSIQITFRVDHTK